MQGHPFVIGLSNAPILVILKNNVHFYFRFRGMSKENIRVEEIDEDNLGAITELSLELWADCSFDEEYANFERILAAESETCYLARNEEDYIAFIQLALRSEHVEGSTGTPVAYVEGIFVKLGYRRHKIGNTLLKIAEDWAKQKHCSQLASDTEPDNPASIKFHLKAEFTEAGKMVCFIKNL